MPATVLPLAPGRYKVQFTATAQLHDKLERLRGLLRSRIPDGDLAAIIEEAVTEKLEQLLADHDYGATNVARPRYPDHSRSDPPSRRRSPSTPTSPP